MTTTIVFFIFGLVLLIAGWMIDCFQSTSFDYASQRALVNLLRVEASEAKPEDQPLKWMHVADEEAELRRILVPRIKWGRVVIAAGVAMILASICRMF